MHGKGPGSQHKEILSTVLYPNAEEFNVRQREELGIKVVDDYT